MENELTRPPSSWPSERDSHSESRRPRRWSLFRVARNLFFAAVVLYMAATAFRLYARKYYIFMPSYARWMLTPTPSAGATPTHVFFFVTDHFEPDYDVDRVRRWADRYRALAARHRDSDGRPPQHGWFYPGEQGDPAIFSVLHDMTTAGLGEVELHYHHHYDTLETLRPQLADAIEDFQQYGFLKTRDGQTHFAFIHGNSDLDNSNGPDNCGVSTELRLLRELGSFADFTFPSIYLDSQPPFVNNIYAAKDDDQPKSYSRPLPLSALRDGSADLMIFQGPLLFTPSWKVSHLFLDLEDGDIHPTVQPSAARVDSWIRANVHVAERPDWVFIKVFAHGISSAADEDAIIGSNFDAALSHLEHEYNDGRRYVLHYITARQAYNLARAAADGKRGDPRQYFDSPIPPYAADGVTPYLPALTRSN